MNNSKLLRFAITGLFSLLIILLVIEDSSEDRLIKSIKSGVQMSHVGEINPKSRDFLIKTVKLAVDICQKDTVYSLNDTSNFESLNIFTYESFLDHPLNFGAGNAIYDATLDAIFIDRNLIEPEQLVSLSDEAMEGDGFRLTGYLVFVLCHELGHRKLHSNLDFVSNLTAISGADKFKIESDADSYAIEKINEYLSHEEPDSELLSLSWDTKRTIGLNINAYDGISKLYVFLASQFWDVAHVYFIGRTTFPPNFSDLAHPPLVQRFVTILENDKLFNEIDNDLKVHRRVMAEWHSRLRTSLDAIGGEIHVDRPIVTASYLDNKWVLISNQAYAFVEDINLTNVSNKRQTKHVNWISLSDAGKEYVESGIPHIFRARDNKLYISDIRSGRIAPLESSSSFEVSAPDISGSVSVPIQPADWIYTSDDTTLYLFTDKWHKKPLSTLRVNISKRFQISDFEIEIVNADQRKLSVILKSKKSDENPVKMIGWILLEADSSFEISDGELFKNPIDFQGKLAILSSDTDQVFFFLVTGIDSEKLVEVFDRFGSLLAHSQIKTHDQPLMSIKKLWLDYPPVWSGDVSYASGGYLMVSYFSDSVYLIDKSGNQHVVLHPQALLSPIEDGRSILIPLMNSYTAYIIDPARVIDTK